MAEAKARRGEFGTIISYQADRYTATVRTEHGRTLTGVPQLRSAPGQIAPLEPGTSVLLNYEYGTPIILGVLPTPVGNADVKTKFSVTDTEGFGGQGLNKTSLNAGSDYRNPQEPDDVAPGDWVQMGSDGNSIGALSGGVNVIRSSALSQIRTHLVNDLVEIISRNYRHITDMGEYSVVNKDGRISMSFRGGTDQRSEAGPDEEKWTIRFDMGAAGDLLNFEFTTPEGQALFRFRVDGDGHCEIFGINGVAIHSGAQNGAAAVETTTGDKDQVVMGNQTTRIDGEVKKEVRGSDKTETLQDHFISAGNDARVQALRDMGLSAGRNLFMAVQGNITGESVIFDIESGDWKVDVGGPTSLNPKSGISFNTFAGDFSHESIAGGDFNVRSLLGALHTTTRKAVVSTNNLPDSVILGGDALTSHLVKYEQLEQHLMMLYQLLDQHIHIEQGTATAGPFPVVGVSGMPVVPFSSVLNSLIITMKSITSGVSL
jgi:hypothetical protein